MAESQQNIAVEPLGAPGSPSLGSPSPGNPSPGNPSAVPLTAPIIEGADRLPEHPPVSDDQLRQSAQTLAARWQQTHITSADRSLPDRLKHLKARLTARLKACEQIANPRELTPQLEFLESTRALEGVLQGMTAAAPEFRDLPHVTVAGGEAIPRVMNLTERYLSAAQGIWSADSLSVFVQAAQPHDVLRLHEILLLPAALKLAQLEYLLDRADEVFTQATLPSIENSPFSAPLHSLRRLGQFEWPDVLEPLVPFQATLAADPANVFSRMEEETRDRYRLRVAELARHADASEMEVAATALKLAHQASTHPNPDPRLHRRLSHIGYYLLEGGFAQLSHQIGYHPPPAERLRALIYQRNEDFYILGIFVLSLLLIVALIAPLVPHQTFALVIGALFLALLPATQGAADLVNNIVTAILRPQALPKLDLSHGIPAEHATLVVIPTLLLSEHGVREMFEDLEARYLANQDPHLHFGLLTDLPDSQARPEPEDRNPLVALALTLTDDLNRKYAGQRGGAFLLLHRHRTFNARQGAWMGWERKRGKLLDLNKFILGDYDSFPSKAGPTDVLRTVRFVITLDSDTQLPRGTAARMIGTMAHPLNQAIVDPELRIVTLGYGILQPRVGVSVSSAARSRLATLYSGETGFDIYTRAVSDVYQDLFGEGIFTGKGIYEVSILHQVLDRRFPRNALLSHDLIEGAYARAGLVTDIEVIDDYPSHHSAHTRRKHRWVRGDWQIVQWLSGHVPDESGHQVPNPISTVSRWKIFDNLRRSLVEPVTFLLLVCGWFFLPRRPALLDGCHPHPPPPADPRSARLQPRSRPPQALPRCRPRRRPDLRHLALLRRPQLRLPPPPDAARHRRHRPLPHPPLRHRQTSARVGDRRPVRVRPQKNPARSLPPALPRPRRPHRGAPPPHPPPARRHRRRPHPPPLGRCPRHRRLAERLPPPRARPPHHRRPRLP